MAIFVALEGPDSVGKSTLHTNLCNKLTAKGYINPGATKFGVEVRKLIKSNLDISNYATQILMAADFVNFIETMAAEDNKEKDRLVILDRANFISGYIYGSSGGLTDAQLKPFQRIIWEALYNHNIMIHIILIMAPQDVINERMAKRPDQKDRFEKRGNAFQTAVYSKYSILSHNIDNYSYIKNYGCNIPRLGKKVSIWNLDGSLSENEMYSEAVAIIDNIRMLQTHNAFFREFPDNPDKT